MGLYPRVAAARGDSASDDHDGAERISAFLVAGLGEPGGLDDLYRVPRRRALSLKSDRPSA